VIGEVVTVSIGEESKATKPVTPDWRFNGRFSGTLEEKDRKNGFLVCV
jgi:hypothetical protein